MKHKINDRPQTASVTTPVSQLSNHKTMNERVVLPLPPNMGEEARFEMEIYARFMRHLREVPNSRMETKILSAIRFTADMCDVCEALVSKTLVDLGLHAPRRAFPVSFLDFVDNCVMRRSWDHGSPPVSVAKLHDHWNRIGEDRFGAMMSGGYSVFNENNYVTA